MFDKLGDLLSEALEKGELPESENKPQHESVEATFSDFNFTSPKKEYNSRVHEQTDSVYNKSNRTEPVSENHQVLRKLPENIRKAFAFINIPETADFNEAKKLYREKLMYYHPDRRNDNPVLQKIAKEKTARLLMEWELIESWFEKKN